MNIFKKKKIGSNGEDIIADYFLKKGYKKNGDFSEEDIFVAGFPKSGNTWMQHVMTGLQYGCTMANIHNNVVRELTPDVHQFSFYKRYNERMVFKTHFLPQSNYKNVILLVRDGRDALTSFYNMEVGRSKENTFEDIVYKNKGLISSWGEFLVSWKKNPFNAKIVQIRYEDMLAEPENELKKIISAFNFHVSENLIAEIIKNCSFDEMRKKEESVFWEKSKDWKENEYFVRKGKIGSYTTEMPLELIKHFESENAELLREFNYKLTE